MTSSPPLLIAATAPAAAAAVAVFVSLCIIVAAQVPKNLHKRLELIARVQLAAFLDKPLQVRQGEQQNC
jgi:hypothetical protein